MICESVWDFLDLCEYFGVWQLDLWGIFYGFYFVLVVIKDILDEIDQVVLVLVEGFDQIVKMLVWIDVYFVCLQVVVNFQFVVVVCYFDIVGMVWCVLECLEVELMLFDILQCDGFVV